jgi:hypothetical protein
MVVSHIFPPTLSKSLKSRSGGDSRLEDLDLSLNERIAPEA